MLKAIGLAEGTERLEDLEGYVKMMKAVAKVFEEVKALLDSKMLRSSRKTLRKTH